MRWQPQRRGQVKCIVYASFSDQLNRIRICICIRDEEGIFVLVKTIHISPMCSVSMGEALALYYNMKWLSDMSFDNVDFTLDSKVTSNVFHHDQVYVTETLQIISTRRRFLTSHFTNSKAELNKLQANEIAHIS
jgi:hypothetical protein